MGSRPSWSGGWSGSRAISSTPRPGARPATAISGDCSPPRTRAGQGWRGRRQASGKRRPHIRVREVVALEVEGQVERGGERLGCAVAQVELCLVARALAKRTVGGEG